ncbi:DUF3429 domain-containing protein [Sphingomonas sp. RS6]
MLNPDHRFERLARLLGYAGLLPLIAATIVSLAIADWRWAMLTGGFAYSALIFSFLGGLWWGQGVARVGAPRWIWGVAVMPSLIGWGLMIAERSGWQLEMAMRVLGVAILMSPAVDFMLAGQWPMPRGWMALRLQLSTGLGLLTLALASM